MTRILAAGLVLAVGIGGDAPAVAQQFSADMVTKSGDGRDGKPAKLYVSGGRIRMEPPGGRGVMLMDSAANTAYALMPEQKAYMDAKSIGRLTQVYEPLDPSDPCPQWEKMVKEARQGDDASWSCKRIGSEQVNGRSTEKYEATSSKGEVAHAWVDPKLKFLVKSDSSNGGEMELRHIVEAPQPDSLFILPADYQKIDMQEMMRHMAQQHDGGAKP